MKLVNDVRQMSFQRKAVALATLIFGCSCVLLPVACTRPKPAEPQVGATSSSPEVKRYALKGKIVSLDPQTAQADIDAEAIPGFMDAMVMPYKIKDSAQFQKLNVGDSISAEVVVQGHDYWLENVKFVTPAAAAPPKSASAVHIPAEGELVPDFELINQNGRHIRLAQYRGLTLLLTFIYTRCPFPDYCPRVNHEFATIDAQLRAQPPLYRATHIISISFDPAHDTPKVLRRFGRPYAGQGAIPFAHWEFAVAPAAQLPSLANFFGFTYKEEGGLITHSLSTAIIGPDGRIVRWYHGNEWQASGLLKDVSDSLHAG